MNQLLEKQSQMKVRLERVKEDIHSLLKDKIPFVLRKYKHEEPVRRYPNRPTPPPYNPRRNKYDRFQTKRLRDKRFIYELIGLGIQGISAYLEHRKTSKFEKGLNYLMRHNTLQDKEIRAIRKDMMSLTKATLKDLTDLKYDVRDHGDMINRLTREVDRMIPQLKAITGYLHDLTKALYLFKFQKLYRQVHMLLSINMNYVNAVLWQAIQFGK